MHHDKRAYTLNYRSRHRQPPTLILAQQATSRLNYVMGVHPPNHTCFTYLTTLELLQHCGPSTPTQHAAQLSAGMAAVLLMPISIFGTVGNLLLIGMFLTRIQRPRFLHIWGTFIVVSDSFTIWIYGFLYAFPTVGAPWWGTYINRIEYHSHLGCKTFMFIRSFISSVKVNALFCVALCELATTPVITAKRRRVNIWSTIVTSVILSIVQAAPTFVAYGIWQSDGVFICKPDPQWAKVYRDFVLLHKTLFSDGLFQVICICPLGILMWRRLDREKRTVQYIKRTQFSRDVVSLVMISVESELRDSCQNLKIILTLIGMTSLCRFPRCIFRIVEYVFLVGHQIKSAYHTRLISITYTGIWACFAFIEVIVAGFSYILWYIHLPEMEAIFSNTWRLCWNLESEAAEQKPANTVGRGYFLRARQQLNILSDLPLDCHMVVDQLDRLREHILSKYANELQLCSQFKTIGMIGSDPVDLQMTPKNLSRLLLHTIDNREHNKDYQGTTYSST